MNEKISHYAASRKWFWYIPALAFAIYVFIASLGFNPNNPNSFIIQALYTIQFGVHEISHLATAFLPSVITAASGSISELILTGTFIGLALYSRYYFAAAFSAVWFMLACQSVGVYMADARAQQLQLVSFGSEKAIHDWNFVFSQLGLLQSDTVIGTGIKVLGIIVGLVGLSFGVYLIIKMMAYKKPVEVPVATSFQKPVADPLESIAKAREADLDNTGPKATRIS